MDTETSALPSLRWLRMGPGARARLFLFPYAGGGASFFRAWANALASGIEVCAIQLPGREDRLRERPYSTLEELVPALARVLRPHRTLPFAFFGHSMGAMLAFELACLMSSDGRGTPLRLLLSAHPPPHLPRSAPVIHGLSDDEFLSEVGRLNGTPAALLEDSEFMSLALPVLRADFTLCETYEHSALEPLDIPLSIFGGSDDPHVPVGQLGAWDRHSRKETSVRVFPGDHFFLRAEREAVLGAINDDLERDLARLS